MTFNGIDLLIAIGCLILILFLLELWQWRIENEERKVGRLVTRNIDRAMGGPRE